MPVTCESADPAPETIDASLSRLSMISADISTAARSAVRTLHLEKDALAEFARCFDNTAFAAIFADVAGMIVNATGRLIVTGMGKSGLIARKIAATMTSTGTPAIYLHAAEAGHGDLGMISTGDVVMAISWSGETAELSEILTFCKRFDVPLISVTSRSTSTLARYASLCVTLPTVEEACPNGLAPTTSTIVQAAFGDALAVALIEVRGFSSCDFMRFHPRGQLGSQLMTINQVMNTGEAIPHVAAGAGVREAILEMSKKRFGITAIVDEDWQLLGAFTDGDLRRALERGMGGAVRDYMTADPITVGPDALVSEVLARMNQHNISQIFVIEDGRLTGVVHLHDVLRTGIV